MDPDFTPAQLAAMKADQPKPMKDGKPRPVQHLVISAARNGWHVRVEGPQSGLCWRASDGTTLDLSAGYVFNNLDELSRAVTALLKVGEYVPTVMTAPGVDPDPVWVRPPIGSGFEAVRAGDTVQETDEVWDGEGWRRPILTGKPVTPHEQGAYRRAIAHVGDRKTAAELVHANPVDALAAAKGWRFLEVGETIGPRDEFLKKGTGTWAWSEKAGSPVPAHCAGRYRRKLAPVELQYRYLESGELVEKGDEFAHGGDVWMPAVHAIGKPAPAAMYRRRV